MIAEDCDGIIAGLYEYWVCYQPHFPQKTTFIPYPIHTYSQSHQDRDKGASSVETSSVDISRRPSRKLKLFIGINKTRSEYKGTDIMLKAAQAIAEKYPEKVELQIAQNVPFAEYVKMMNGSDAILDQLYSYTPSMNPLEAMARASSA